MEDSFVAKQIELEPGSSTMKASEANNDSTNDTSLRWDDIRATHEKSLLYYKKSDGIHYERVYWRANCSSTLEANKDLVAEVLSTEKVAFQRLPVASTYSIDCPLCKNEVSFNKVMGTGAGKAFCRHLTSHAALLESGERVPCPVCYRLIRRKGMKQHLGTHPGHQDATLGDPQFGVLHFTSSVRLLTDKMENIERLNLPEEVVQLPFVHPNTQFTAIRTLQKKWKYQFRSDIVAKLEEDPTNLGPLLRFKLTGVPTKPIFWMCGLCDETHARSNNDCFFNDISLRFYVLRHLGECHMEVPGVADLVDREWGLLATELNMDYRNVYGVTDSRAKTKNRSAYFYFVSYGEDTKHLMTEMLHRSDKKLLPDRCALCVVCLNPVSVRHVSTHFSQREASICGTAHSQLNTHPEKSEFHSVREIAECPPLRRGNFPFAVLRYSMVFRLRDLDDAASLNFYKWRCVLPSTCKGHYDDVLEFPSRNLLIMYALRHFEKFHSGVFSERFLQYEWDLLRNEVAIAVDLRNYDQFQNLSGPFDIEDPNDFVLSFQHRLLPKAFSAFKVCGFCFWTGLDSQFLDHVTIHNYMYCSRKPLVSNDVLRSLTRAVNSRKDYVPIELGRPPKKIVGSEGKKLKQSLPEKESKSPSPLPNGVPPEFEGEDPYDGESLMEDLEEIQESGQIEIPAGDELIEEAESTMGREDEEDGQPHDHTVMGVNLEDTGSITSETAAMTRREEIELREPEGRGAAVEMEQSLPTLDAPCCSTTILPPIGSRAREDREMTPAGQMNCQFTDNLPACSWQTPRGGETVDGGSERDPAKMVPASPARSSRSAKSKATQKLRLLTKRPEPSEKAGDEANTGVSSSSSDDSGSGDDFEVDTNEEEEEETDGESDVPPKTPTRPSASQPPIRLKSKQRRCILTEEDYDSGSGREIAPTQTESSAMSQLGAAPVNLNDSSISVLSPTTPLAELASTARGELLKQQSRVREHFKWEGPAPPPLAEVHYPKLKLMKNGHCPLCPNHCKVKGARMVEDGHMDGESFVLAHLVVNHVHHPFAQDVLDMKRYKISENPAAVPTMFLLDRWDVPGQLVCSSCCVKSFPRLSVLRTHYGKCLRAGGHLTPGKGGILRADHHAGQAPSPTSSTGRGEGKSTSCVLSHCVSKWRTSSRYVAEVGQVCHLINGHYMEKEAYEKAIHLSDTCQLDSTFPFLDVAESFRGKVADSNGPNFVCAKCGNASKTITELVQHATRYHTEHAPISQSLRCPFGCDVVKGRTAASKTTTVVRHLIEQHLPDEKAVVRLADPELAKAVDAEDRWRFDIAKSVKATLSQGTPKLCCAACGELVSPNNFLQHRTSQGCPDIISEAAKQAFAARRSESEPKEVEVEIKTVPKKAKASTHLDGYKACSYCTRSIPQTLKYSGRLSLLFHILRMHRFHPQAIEELREENPAVYFYTRPFVDIRLSLKQTQERDSRSMAVCCAVCEKASGTVREHVRHVQVHEQLLAGLDDTESSLSCDDCDQSIGGSRFLSEDIRRLVHLIDYHRTEKGFEDKAMGIATTISPDASPFLSAEKSIGESITSEGTVLCCSKCEKVFTNTLALQFHSVAHEKAESTSSLSATPVASSSRAVSLSPTKQKKAMFLCLLCNNLYPRSDIYCEEMSLFNHYMKQHATKEGQQSLGERVDCSALAGVFPFVNVGDSFREMRWRCSLCAGSFSDMSALIKHARNLHYERCWNAPAEVPGGGSQRGGAESTDGGRSRKSGFHCAVCNNFYPKSLLYCEQYSIFRHYLMNHFNQKGLELLRQTIDCASLPQQFPFVSVDDSFGSRRFTCSICSGNFADSNSLVKHAQKVHADKCAESGVVLPPGSGPSSSRKRPTDSEESSGNTGTKSKRARLTRAREHNASIIAYLAQSASSQDSQDDSDGAREKRAETEGGRELGENDSERGQPRDVGSREDSEDSSCEDGLLSGHRNDDTLRADSPTGMMAETKEEESGRDGEEGRTDDREEKAVREGEEVREPVARNTRAASRRRSTESVARSVAGDQSVPSTPKRTETQSRAGKAGNGKLTEGTPKSIMEPKWNDAFQRYGRLERQLSAQSSRASTPRRTPGGKVKSDGKGDSQRLLTNFLTPTPRRGMSTRSTAGQSDAGVSSADEAVCPSSSASQNKVPNWLNTSVGSRSVMTPSRAAEPMMMHDNLSQSHLSGAGGTLADALGNLLDGDGTPIQGPPPAALADSSASIFDELPEVRIGKLLPSKKMPVDVSHIQGIHGFTCPECPFVGVTRKDVRDHVQLVHCESSAKKKIEERAIVSACVLCQEMFPSRQKLFVHISMAHRGEQGAWPCTFCSSTFSNKLRLREHERRQHESTVLANPSDLACSHCGERFLTVRSRKVHEQRHADPRSNVGTAFL